MTAENLAASNRVNLKQGVWMYGRPELVGMSGGGKAGVSIDDIMEWFDGLKREQLEAVIDFARAASSGIS